MTTLAKEFDALIAVSRTINAHLDLDTVLESVMSVATNVLNAEASSLVLIDETTGDLLFHVAYGEKAYDVKQMRMKKGVGIVGWVIDNGKSVIDNDVSKNPQFFKKVDEESGFQTRAILCVPLETTKKLWGAIEVINKIGGGNFTNHDMLVCETIAGQAAIAIENAMLHRQIVKSERLAAIGQTIAGLAHCIKNVLHGIKGGSYIVDLGMKKDDNEKITKGWEVVKKNNIFMQELVLDMLTYSKERKPEYQMCDINEIIESLCRLLESKADENNVQLTFTPASLGEVELDPKGVRRCLLNLMTNAVEACAGGQDGCVDVSLDVVDDTSYNIVITDNGCGISDEARKKLFTMFFSTKGSKGTGLGLAVTHKIITEHGGTIDVDSEPGKGTTFTVSLPRHRV